MKRIPASIVASGAVLLLAFSMALDAAPLQDEAPPESAAVAVPPRSAIEMLLDEVAGLNDEIGRLRQQLADANLRASTAESEAAELRQFLADHREFGDDFAQYQEVKAIAERETKRRRIDEMRERRDAERAARLARQAEQRAARTRENAEDQRLDRLRNAGFGHIGLDVMTGRMAYSYKTKETDSIRVDYDPILGRYLRPSGRTAELDYGTMTISGSVVNAAAAVRNIGIAIAFFDEYGNQVGGEIIQINNARPDVPYPFTSTVDMALNRAFSSSSTYVLYADPIATDDS